MLLHRRYQRLRLNQRNTKKHFINLRAYINIFILMPTNVKLTYSSAVNAEQVTRATGNQD